MLPSKSNSSCRTIFPNKRKVWSILFVGPLCKRCVNYIISSLSFFRVLESYQTSCRLFVTQYYIREWASRRSMRALIREIRTVDDALVTANLYIVSRENIHNAASNDVFHGKLWIGNIKINFPFKKIVCVHKHRCKIHIVINLSEQTGEFHTIYMFFPITFFAQS